MPALFLPSLLNTLTDRNAIANFSIASIATNTTTNTSNPLQVVCAWPVSGQYGVGSRILYYILVSACVVARKAEWLRNACLAAALLFPAVAALHGIVLAAVHVNGAVDMDVFGAFQLCSIGILAAPVTVRMSRTYFFDPGRNMIFLWTGLIFAGLLSLMVEFYRLNASHCDDSSGQPISSDEFNYGNTICSNLVCNTSSGPFSPLRGGSANNIYVIPSPDKLTFNTATLLAAGCCIPAILSLVSMWIKILEVNWRSRFGDGDEEIDEPMDGTNGATVGEMSRVNTMIRMFLSALEIPVFGAAILAILILGELNFFSTQVAYQTEPIASIGQWAPIVGTGLAALGSLYLLFAADLEAIKDNDVTNTNGHMQHCNCSHHHYGSERGPISSIRAGEGDSLRSRDAPSMHREDLENPPQNSMSMQEIGRGISTMSSHSAATPGATDIHPTLSNGGEETPSIVVPTISHSLEQDHEEQQSSIGDVGYRRKVAKTLVSLGNALGTAAHDQFDNSEFKQGKALDFPEIPGEEHRNSELPRIRERYNQSRSMDIDESREQPSRASSFVESVNSRANIERRSTTPRPALSQSPQSSNFPSLFPSSTTPRKQHSNTLPVGRSSFEPPSPSGDSQGDRIRPRRDTLEVPSPVHYSFTRDSHSASLSQGNRRS